MVLSSQKVRDIFMECLFKEGEATDNMVKAEGIMHTFGFNPERLSTHKDKIMSLLLDLPVEFLQSCGGGYSFLNACMNKDNIQWTGDHATMEQLLCLGLATQQASYVMPKEMWGLFPGGMPYFTIHDTNT
jgi:hypothetical protein